jgi:hypothetical protein
MLGYIHRGASIVALSLLSSAAMAQTAPGNPSLPPTTPPPPVAPAPPAPAPAPLPEPTPAPPVTESPGYSPMPPPVTAAPTEITPPPSESDAPGVREHDGFYARFGLGTSGYTDTLVSEDFVPAGSPAGTPEQKSEGVLTGFATVSEVSLGGTVARGFVVGLGFWSASALTLTYTETEEGPPPPEEFVRPENFALAGPFFDWFFNAKKGLHWQLGLGFAVLHGLNPDTPRLRDRDTAIGGGLMLGLGYDWFVSRQWSIGVLGRFTAGVVTEEDDAGVRWTHIPVAFPSTLFTAVYH